MISLRVFIIIPNSLALIYSPPSTNLPLNYEHHKLRGNGPPVLILNGFGVGLFHQSRLIEELKLKASPFSEVYTIDYLGQGKSWPPPSSSTEGISYNAKTWVSHLSSFVRDVISAPPVLVGNSLGGYLAPHVARFAPVHSIVLANATPVWKGPLSSLPWDGSLPAPCFNKLVGSAMYDVIRSPPAVEFLLRQCYSNPAARSGLASSIMEMCSNPLGHDAFTSIISSPGLGPFGEALDHARVQVHSLHGDRDPWISVASARYYSRGKVILVGGAGHCVLHEGAAASATALNSIYGQGDLLDEDVEIEEEWGGKMTLMEVEPEVSAIEKMALRAIETMAG